MSHPLFYSGHRTRKPLVAALALAAIVASQASSATLQSESAQSAAARRGLAFAEQRCSGCHAVAENRISPNPESPSFQEIANRTGVTPATLRQFLRDSHNYPSAMNFRVEAEQISDLADYIATMRRAGYRPVM